MVAIDARDLITQVENQLIWDSRVTTSNIQVQVKEGKAILSGTVPDYRSRIAAEEDVKMIRGSTHVDNQLQIDYPSHLGLEEEEISQRVCSLLQWAREIDSDRISVDVSGSVVTLKGSVDSYWKKFYVTNSVYLLYGITEVINELAIVPTQDIQDLEIAADIETALERSTGVNVNDVNVKVEKGVVTLDGTVADWNSRQIAHNIAIHTKGVLHTIDRIFVS